MARVELSRDADADIVGILEYGARHFGWDRAEAYAETFDDSFALLSTYPLIGVMHDDVRPPIRSLHHRSHRIFYDVEDEIIVVQRILHQSMDVKLHLG